MTSIRSILIATILFITDFDIIGLSASAESNVFDVETHDRHDRSPEEKDAETQHNAYCQPGDDNIYGVKSPKKLDLSYFYEVEVSVSGEEFIDWQIIPYLEEEIIYDIVSDVFEICGGRRRERKLGIIANNLKQFLRKNNEYIAERSVLERTHSVVGIDTMPFDKIDKETVCQGNVEGDNLCVSVVGGITLYLDNDNTDTTNKVLKENTLQMLRNRMISGRYNMGVNTYIRKVSFIGDQLKPYEANAQNLVIIGDQSEVAGGRRFATKYVLFSSIGAIVIFSIAFMGKRAVTETDVK